MPQTLPITAGRVVLSVLFLLMLLSGCGGDGGAQDGRSPSGGSSVQISGVVMDGPIQGAQVFLDLNANLAHDSGEPLSAETDARGGFTLVTPRLTPAQRAAALLVAHVPMTARDASDGGATLGEAGKNGFTLMSPASAYLPATVSQKAAPAPALLTPLTTLVAGEMTFNGLSLADAKAAVRQQLGLPDKDPLTHFVDEGDVELGNIARAAAVAMGNARQTLQDLARQQGGVVVRDQVAAVFLAVRAQLPSLVEGLNLRQASARNLTPDRIDEELAKPDLAAPLTQAVQETRHALGDPTRYVVVLKPDVVNAAAAAMNMADDHSGQVRYTYGHTINGFAVTLPERAAEAFLEAMQRDPKVDYVEIDKPVRLLQAVQLNASWGLDRVDQRGLPLNGHYSYSITGAGVQAHVVDTGILAGHADFGGRVEGGFSTINDGRGTSDCNGHGTHVAGTIGGRTWGVAKDVTLVPVRVLDCEGSGSLSGVIAGLEWVAANARRPAVVNLSLGGGVSPTLDAAVANLVKQGIPVVVAAGNSNANACNYSPAREPLAITVGASTSSDTRSSFSNFGTCLDLFAPGSSIRSAWHTSPTATALSSGTSMASPHVAGRAALLLQSNPGATPAQVEEVIRNAATSDRLTDPGFGSPNLLLYTAAVDSSPPPSGTPTPVAVGALNGSSARLRNGWRASVTITVRDAEGAAVADAVVAGGFTAGGSSLKCTTSSNGTCIITSGTITRRRAETTFSVKDISGTGLRYDASRNAVASLTLRRR